MPLSRAARRRRRFASARPERSSDPRNLDLGHQITCVSDRFVDRRLVLRPQHRQRHFVAVGQANEQLRDGSASTVPAVEARGKRRRRRAHATSVAPGARARRPTPLPAVLAEHREQDHVSDSLASRQHHRQPVDPETEAAGRRHPIGERLDVVRVAGLAADEPRLLGETRRLGLGVVDLRERVAELHSGDEVLEPLCERGVVFRRTRERRQLHRVVVDDRRLDELRLDEVREGVVDELRPASVLARVDPTLGKPRTQLLLIASPELDILQRLDEA